MYVLEWWTVSALTRGLFWCLFPKLWSNEGNKYQDNTRVSQETRGHESTYIILFLTRYNKSINDDKNHDLYTSSQCLTCSVFILLMRSNEGNKYQDNTQVSPETGCHKSTYIILFLTWYNESINDDKNHDLYTSSQCLTCSVFILLMRSIEGNKYQDYTQVSPETGRHESTYIILFLTWYNESINDDKNHDLYTSSQCLTCSVFILLMPSNEGNEYQDNTRVSPETGRHESTYIIIFLTRYNKSINDDKNHDLYTSS